MKLNCDMGESYGAWVMGNDAAIMPFIDQANIACGFHASEPLTMFNTVSMAVGQGVEVGAHPGYPDLVGFGRRPYHCSKEELIASLLYQIGALEGICRNHGVRLSYVKPHGALYNRMMVDTDTLDAVMTAVSQYRRGLPLMVMATPEAYAVQARADHFHLPLLFEAFVDRAYDDEGLLVNRRVSGAVHTDLALIEAQVRQIVLEKSVTSLSGRRIPIVADTLCIHGDSELAVESARFVRELVDSL
jgi:UPF0271 protein